METVFGVLGVGSTGRWRTHHSETGWHLSVTSPMSANLPYTVAIGVS